MANQLGDKSVRVGKRRMARSCREMGNSLIQLGQFYFSPCMVYMNAGKARVTFFFRELDIPPDKSLETS